MEFATHPKIKLIYYFSDNEILNMYSSHKDDPGLKVIITAIVGDVSTNIPSCRITQFMRPQKLSKKTFFEIAKKVQYLSKFE